MYQCFLSNDVGEDTRSTWLKIKSKPNFTRHIVSNDKCDLGEPPVVTVSKDVIVFNGTDVQLTCTVNGSPLPNITWFKTSTDNERTPVTNIDNRFHVDNRTGLLSISNTIRDDSGAYECLAQNILGSAHARTSVLVRRECRTLLETISVIFDYLGRTRIIALPPTMRIVKAQSLILTCHVFSEDDIAKRIYWYFNSNQPIARNRLYNESTIVIDTPQNQDTVRTLLMTACSRRGVDRLIERV